MVNRITSNLSGDRHWERVRLDTLRILGLVLPLPGDHVGDQAALEGAIATGATPAEAVQSVAAMLTRDAAAVGHHLPLWCAVRYLEWLLEGPSTCCLCRSQRAVNHLCARCAEEGP